MGGLIVLAFALVHGIWISNIWFNIVPMVLAGVLCGLCVVWSYQKTVIKPSSWRWLAYNAGSTVSLVALGGASILVFDPRFTMAEVLAADDALSLLMPPTLPLMGAWALIGTTALWLVFGRRRSALLPILAAQTLLTFLIGHNLAILGLVELPSDQFHRVIRFVGLTGFLGGAFAITTLATTAVKSRLIWPVQQ